MKKRTKITLRTKIYLTIVALLALTGVFYAQFPPAHPSPFTGGVPFPTGVAAAPDLLLVSEFCSGNIDKVDCNGNVSLFAMIPTLGGCAERYMTIAPSAAAAAGFHPRDVFVTRGALVFKVDVSSGTNNVTLYAALQGCVASDHNGITFDKTGNFGFDMIVTCREGNVFRLHGDPNDGNTAPIAGPFGQEIEGPAVVPIGFGPNGGQIWVADEDANAVHALENTNPPGPGPYVVHPNILSHQTAEGIYVVPNPPCPICGDASTGFAFALAEQQLFQSIFLYPMTDFTLPPPGLGGNVLITSESGGDNADTTLVTVSGPPPGTYVLSSFGPRIPGINEGSSFVDCDVPTATPTPTPSATFTPTPSATATFTPTPSATFTPTPSATFTPTPSATFTPTPSATFTPTPTPTPTGSCNPLASCTPPYPFSTPGFPRTNVPFNESEVLRAFRTTVVGGCNPTQIQLFYNDEHALTLGVRQIQVKTAGGTTTTNYPISPLTMDPDQAFNPLVGSTIQVPPPNDQAGTDPVDRPMFPAIFVTDVTNDPTSLAGDWQFGGTGQTPNFVAGTWKGAVKIIDKTQNPTKITVTPDMDPPENNYNLGPIPPADPVPPGLVNQGYGAEVRWNVDQLHDENGMPLQGGHTYRLYFMVHDGDQNKTGGDVGQGCSFVTIPAFTPTPTPTASPTATPTAAPITVTNKVFSAKTVQITFLNSTASNQVLNALQITWPQATNGNLKTVTMGPTTIFNTQTGGGNMIDFSLNGTNAQRTIAPGASQTLTFTFANNVNTTASNYTGTATFSPFGPVMYLP
jgi:hypothetical protein